MIVCKQKPFEQILKIAEGYRSLLIVGCNGCTGIYQVGGEKQAEVMRTLMEMAGKLRGVEEKKLRAMTVLRQCDRQIAATSVRPLIEEYEAVLSMACGVGVQTLAEAFEDKVILPANDTEFIGMQNRELGGFYELCGACGECIIHETGGICPKTRCAKGLLNGPCGGQVEGKCEVDDYKKDCAWILIWHKLKSQNRLDLFSKFRSPNDWKEISSPRQITNEG